MTCGIEMTFLLSQSLPNGLGEEKREGGGGGGGGGREGEGANRRRKKRGGVLEREALPSL